ncbi:MAG: adenylate/guanylate cyclase domain-containing protein [Chlamydiales bacterium]
MDTIRVKLFLSISIILLIIGILSYFIPKSLIQKDISATSSDLMDRFIESEEKIQLAFATLVMSQFIEQTAQMEGLSRLLGQEASVIQQQSNLRQQAAQILQYALNLAYIQISNHEEMVILAPENAPLYDYEWAEMEDQTLLIRSDHHLYTARLVEQNEAFYFLYPIHEFLPLSQLTFRKAGDLKPKFQPENLDQLYEEMVSIQNQIVDKVEMIKILSDKPQEAVGILKADGNFQQGYLLLEKDLFLSKPEIETFPLPKIPYLILRQNGSLFYLDLIRDLTIDNAKIIFGFSLSTIAEQVTSILKRPILISSKNGEGLLFFPDGSKIILQPNTFNLNFLEYKGIFYQVDPHQIEELTISILTNVDRWHAISRMMNRLYKGLIQKISGELLLVTLIVFFLGLFFLMRIAKKITQPISQLANAAKKIGNGYYDNLQLPIVKKRKDEVAILTHSFVEMVNALREREKIRGALNKVVSKEVATEILSSNIELGGEERIVTLLFSDIRNFTQLSNHYQPKLLIQMLNEYMTRMCQIIDETQGVVDKFVGDEIMALYGAPLYMEDQADQALKSASQMIQSLKNWNTNQAIKGKELLEIGIGIHTGSVCTGNMGGENRLNYTAIGSNVNLASRMCKAAHPMQILVSQETIQALKNPKKFTFLPLPPIKLKGFDQPICLYEMKESSFF